MTAADDYGASAVHLETLRRLVDGRCERVRFAGFTPQGARVGAYSFLLFSQREGVAVTALRARDLMGAVIVLSAVVGVVGPFGSVRFMRKRIDRR